MNELCEYFADSQLLTITTNEQNKTKRSARMFNILVFFINGQTMHELQHVLEAILPNRNMGKQKKKNFQYYSYNREKTVGIEIKIFHFLTKSENRTAVHEEHVLSSSDERKKKEKNNTQALNRIA